MVATTTWARVLVVVTTVVTTCRAYIPAVATNDSSLLEMSSSDRLTIAFYNGVYSTFISKQLDRWEFDDNGNYTNVSSIVPWTKFSKGVLLHFDESLRLQQPSAVPWIAMVNCDTNGTNFDDELDIFTITRDLGAQAALLYSVTSAGCVMNQEYLDVYEKVLDVYATTTVSSARIIEQQFANIGISDEAYSYDSARLNNSADVIASLLNSNALSVIGNVPVNGTVSDADNGQVDVEPTLETLVDADEPSTSMIEPTLMPGANATATADGQQKDEEVSTTTTTMSRISSRVSPTTSDALKKRQNAPSTTINSSTKTSVLSTATSTSLNFLGAVMAARNNTVGGLLNPSSASPSPSAGSGGGGGGGSSNTGLAMIILYAITGVVTFMFMLVILSGAIRAIRHPERYGPRPGGGPHGNGLDGAGPRQTRAHGLTKAILDTFPVVKFGSTRSQNVNENGNTSSNVNGRDIEAQKAIELEEFDRATNESRIGAGGAMRMTTAIPTRPTIEPTMSTTSGRQSSLERRVSDSTRSRADTFVSAREEIVPVGANEVVTQQQQQQQQDSAHIDGAAGNANCGTTTALPLTINPADVDDGTTCPICVCEFEEGEEIRILPCDARHRFHCECIDPWLLDVSSLCPLCRLDLSGGTIGNSTNGRGRAAPTSGGADNNNNSSSRSRSEDDDDEADEQHAEAQVRSNLRAMLHGTRARALSSGNNGVRSGPTMTGMTDAGQQQQGGSATSRMRFFRYVANRRRQQQSVDHSTPSTQHA
ncbi:hypothetical protein OIO90_006047 [Microbotryomycetes sp. JL221]|nr:hypothetical protein OIO90_006047 [Microbotryomycetes sp. JL221]